MSVLRKLLAMPDKAEQAAPPNGSSSPWANQAPVNNATAPAQSANGQQHLVQPQQADVFLVPEDGLPPGFEPWPFDDNNPPPPGLVPNYIDTTPDQSPARHESGRSERMVASSLREQRPAFEVVDERKPSPAAKVLRYLLLFLVVILCLTGIRAIIWPYGVGRSGPPVTTESGSTFPAGEASQVATRFATSYLTWDERNRDARASAIGLDLAQGLDAAAGWSGEGVQTVAAVYPGEVKTDNDHQAHVVVLARVVPYKGAGQNWTALPATWRRLSIPVEVGPSRVVVTGTPAYLADVPGSGSANQPEPVEADDQLTASTEADARAFFSAFATSDEATAAITAPSAKIRSLNKTVELLELKSWTVQLGDADRRTARASVTWKAAGTTTKLTQDYGLTLIRSTAADGTQRWQVAEITNN
ncbi:conjugal transfer protein [Kribbella sp. NPDC049174]|uniref:conjugal transfer protein n=1 Tax=Kribbella sp. NPDC049174 TaxID=3364112 RepID=UPI00371E8D2C